LPEANSVIQEPTTKRAIIFVDGQNLFYAVKEAFGYTHPNYDVQALAEWVCGDQGWQLEEVRFYTGIPSVQDNPKWNTFWSRKLSVMGKAGIHSLRGSCATVTRPSSCPMVYSEVSWSDRRKAST
jgi:hypothetical protein